MRLTLASSAAAEKLVNDREEGSSAVVANGVLGVFVLIVGPQLIDAITTERRMQV